MESMKTSMGNGNYYHNGSTKHHITFTFSHKCVTQTIKLNIIFKLTHHETKSNSAERGTITVHHQTEKKKKTTHHYFIE